MRWGRRRAIAVAGAVLLLLGLAGAHAAGLDRLPDVESVMRSGLPNDTLVYDRTGTVLLADIQRPGAQHTDVPLAAMGRWLPAATVALDDPGFWSEPGVDAGRLARAARDDLWGRRGGETGSSIVTRLIALRLGPPAGAAARVRAAALAVRIAASVPRARILERYLNSLPYGNGAIGAEAAAITYFQVDAGQLDLAQASLLAGLPAAPTRLDPLRSLAAAKDRQRQVLDAMVRDRLVSRQEAGLALAEPLHLVGPAALDVAPVLVHQVVAELTSRYGADAVTARGFTVLSTLDWGLQQQADLALRQALDASRARHVTAGALAAVDPRTGEILALADAGTPGQHDFATSVPRSPGTAFRVFTYAAAIAGRAYTMITPVDDAPISVDMGAGAPSYRPGDFDHRDHGACELRACAGNDLNVPAVRVELTIGVPAVVESARALGA
ncbi:MAG TPA: transglycosylase domain-containing protein, partial [Candidatus Eisenbacteria bacterium]|nr:transglycosylase domain-containing protein [Candidatus Eisenbacteria bacterium]